MAQSDTIMGTHQVYNSASDPNTGKIIFFPNVKPGLQYANAALVLNPGKALELVAKLLKLSTALKDCGDTLRRLHSEIVRLEGLTID